MRYYLQIVKHAAEVIYVISFTKKDLINLSRLKIKWHCDSTADRPSHYPFYIIDPYNKNLPPAKVWRGMGGTVS